MPQLKLRIIWANIREIFLTVDGKLSIDRSDPFNLSNRQGEGGRRGKDRVAKAMICVEHFCRAFGLRGALPSY